MSPQSLNDYVWRWIQNGYGGDQREKCEHYQTEPVDDHCRVLPVVDHLLVVLLVSHVIGDVPDFVQDELQFSGRVVAHTPGLGCRRRRTGGPAIVHSVRQDARSKIVVCNSNTRPPVSITRTNDQRKANKNRLCICVSKTKLNVYECLHFGPYLWSPALTEGVV